MIWLYYTAGSIACFTLLNLLQRIVAVDSKDPRATAVVYNLCASVIALLIFVASGSYSSFILPKEPSAWVYLAIAMVGYGLFERGRFFAAKLLDASALTTVMTLSIVISIFGSFFLYSEPFGLNKVFGALTIILAVTLVSYNKGIGRLTVKSIVFMVLLNISLGVAWMLDKMGTKYFNANTYSIFVWVIPLFIIYLPYIPIKTLKNELIVGGWKVWFLAGTNVFGYLLQLKALELAQATRVLPLMQLSTLFTVVFGILFLRERTNFMRKIIGSILAVVGVFFIMGVA